MSLSPRFEVQTKFTYGWENCWSETIFLNLEDSQEIPQTFDTHDLAMAAIYEFFADLSRAGMAQSYQLEDYRVSPVIDAVQD